MVTETWFHTNISDTSVSLPNYNIIRCDRTNKKGGGVAFYFNTFLNVHKITLPFSSPNIIDFICINFSHNICYLIVYVPPNINVATSNSITEFISNSFDYVINTLHIKYCILCGDFNNLDLSTIYTLHNVKNIINVPTRGNNILDLFIVDTKILSQVDINFEILDPISTSDHNMIHIKSCNLLPPTHKYVTFFDYRDSNIRSFIQNLSYVNWSPLYEANNIQDKCDIFYNLLQPAINSIPSTTIRLNDSDKPWITPLCKMLIQLRWNAFRHRNFTLYEHYKLKCKEEIKKAKSRWTNSTKRKKNGLWNLINSTRKPKQSPFFDFSATDINNYFCSIFGDYSDLTQFDFPDDDWNIHITPDDVIYYLNKFNIKGIGSDLISSKLLKASVDVISNPVAHLLNISIQTRQVPDAWKLAKVTPVPKCKRPDLKDLRPISNLPVLAKLLERIIYTNLSTIFTSNYGKFQYGFRKKSNTVSALIALTDDLTRDLDNPTIGGVTLVSFDASKAFDTVNHYLIIQRLLNTNIPKGFIKWYTSYLTNRRQYVEFNNNLSPTRQVTSGVPQGAILSPAIFCIFVSNITPLNSLNSLYMYADDILLKVTHFITSDNNLPSNELVCTSELNNIYDKARENGIKLNKSKSNRLCIYKRGRNYDYPCFLDIPRVHNLKILGVFFSEDLSFSHHISESIKKASKNLFLIKSFKPYLNRNEIIILLNSLIYSIINYGSEIFYGFINHSDTALLYKFYKKIHRTLCTYNCTNECIKSFTSTFHHNFTKLFNKILLDSNHILHHRCPQFLPHRRRLNITHSHTNKRLDSFFIYGSILYNSNH